MLTFRYFFSLNIFDVCDTDQDLHELKTRQDLSHTSLVLFFRFIYSCSGVEMGTLDALGDEMFFDI